MRNIGIVIRALSIGGAEKQSLLLAKNLSESFNVYFFVQREYPRANKHTDFIEKEKIKYIQLSGNLFSRIKQMTVQIKKHEIEIIFSYLTSDNLLASACGAINQNLIIVGGVRNCLLPKTKMVVTKILHQYFMDYTIFNNESGKEMFVQHGFSKNKCKVIHNCYNNFSEYVHRKKGDSVKIISVGRFVPQKDYFTALRAFNQLQKSNPQYNLKYNIVGYGKQEREIRRFVDKHQINNVEIVINPPNVIDLYKESDIYFCSSIFEGLSNTLMEALDYNLPIVATDVGDNKYLVKENANGFLCASNDHAQMAEKLEVLVKDEKLRIEFGKNGNSLLKTRFSEDQFKNIYFHFINKINVNEKYTK